jgi:PAS domain S-box-containing protein
MFKENNSYNQELFNGYSVSKVRNPRKMLALLKQIIDNSFDEVYVTDGKGITIFGNPACIRHYGVSLEEILDKDVKELEKKGLFYPSAVLKVLKTKNMVTVIQKTGIGKEILVTANPVLNKNKEIVMVVCNCKDISELFNLQIPTSNHRKYSGCSKGYSLQQFAQLNIVGNSNRFKNTINTCHRISTVDSIVLLLGETGVGKSVFARAIHELSARNKGPFVKVNCGAIPASLIESELFGYEKGSFTGANKEGNIGLIESAHNGTLFLDEVAELPLNLQVKLMHVLEEKQVTRIGGRKPVDVDFRLIAATNRNLKKMVNEGTFRQDFYYRLYVVPITVPPLRERREDIIPLIRHYLKKYNEKYNESKHMAPEVPTLLSIYHWPGNVRELENIIERMVVTVPGDEISAGNLPEEIRNLATSNAHNENLFDAVEKLKAYKIRHQSKNG